MLESETRTANGWPTVHTDRLIWGEEGSAKEDATLLGCCVVKQLRGFFSFLFFFVFLGGRFMMSCWRHADKWWLHCVCEADLLGLLKSNRESKEKQGSSHITRKFISFLRFCIFLLLKQTQVAWCLKQKSEVSAWSSVFFHWSILLCTLSLMLNCFKKHAGPCEYYQSLYHIESKQ